MAFDFQGFEKCTAAANTNNPQIWAYSSLAETLSTIQASNYFLPLYGVFPIASNEYLYVTGSDGTTMIRFNTVNSTTVTTAAISTVAAGSIDNADIDAAAAIDFSKLAALTSGNILVGNGSNVAASVTPSGAITMTNAGVVSLATTYLTYATVAISAAQFNGAYASPFTLVAAPGANKLLVLERAELVMTYNSAAFASGGTVAIQYDVTANGAGVAASTTLANTVFQATASAAFPMNGATTATPFTTCVNKALCLSNITGAFTTGNSTFVAHLWYRTIATA